MDYLHMESSPRHHPEPRRARRASPIRWQGAHASAQRGLLVLMLLACGSVPALAAGVIRLNQVGFLPAASKIGVVNGASGGVFQVVVAGTGKEVMRGTLRAPAAWAPSGETVRLADFSSLDTPGTYQLKVDGALASPSFAIGADVYRAVSAAALKSYYFNRAGTALSAPFAGGYARAAGHPDTAVRVHASAATATRPAGTVFASPRGWYDAGDYNKYIVNSGIATYTLLAAYEHFPAYFQAQNLNLPERGNGIPDILNETLWNLEWMLSMQDSDGGVYHKLTNEGFDAYIMPSAATSARYVVQKTTAATLDFAAVMATASRVMAAFESKRPGLSARMLTAAESAWKWAKANPAVIYRQATGISTGEYGDSELADEFAWAAAELYISSGKDSYYAAMQADRTLPTVPWWKDVRGLAWVSLAHHRAHLSAVADQNLIASRVDSLAADLAARWKNSAFGVPMQTDDFVWGSNAVALNQALMLIQGYRLNGKPAYLQAAQAGFDYILGRNATDISFVTGYGSQTPRHPHHRISEADGVAAPVPGMLVGGPQPGQQDKADCTSAYPSALPAKSYLDHMCSYASNEVAINWNAPLVYVAAALQVLTER